MLGGSGESVSFGGDDFEIEDDGGLEMGWIACQQVNRALCRHNELRARVKLRAPPRRTILKSTDQISGVAGCKESAAG
jgi:hypothetical protein